MFTNLTKLYQNNNNPEIKGRESELRNLFLTLLRHEKPNALLIGAWCWKNNNHSSISLSYS